MARKYRLGFDYLQGTTVVTGQGTKKEMSVSRTAQNMPPQEVSYTDLLIIGAGPAGMMAAAWANQYDIKTRIIDKNNARIGRGQADGLQARTLEIFDSFGVAEGVWKRGFHDIEICTWVSWSKELPKPELRFISARPWG